MTGGGAARSLPRARVELVELLGENVWVNEVFCGVESGVWVWCGVEWCVALRGLRWAVVAGYAGAVVGRPEAERGGVATCPCWTTGLAAPVAQAAVAVAVSPPGPLAGVLRALLVWGVVWCLVAV